MRGLLEANAISFGQLWDRRAEVTRAYGVPLDVFTICLVGEGGRIVRRAEDPRGDIKGIMEEMLIGGAVETPVPVAGDAGLAFRGSERLRFLSIDSRGEEAVGPYGEEVKSQNNFLQRFELEVSRRLGRYVTVGGLVRISNEGRDVLRSGPQYFDSDWEAHLSRSTSGVSCCDSGTTRSS